MKHLLRDVEKLIIPIILIIAGCYALWFHSSEGADGKPQPIDMMLGGVALIVSGVLMTLVFFKLAKNKFVNIALTVLLGIVALLFLFRVFSTIFKEDKHRKTRDAYTEATVQRLKDLKFSQEKYRDYNGVYTQDLDKLISWLEKDIIPVPYRNGNVLEDKFFNLPENADKKKNRNDYIIHRDSLPSLGMTEEEARAKNFEIRDTTYTSHKAKYFSDAYREKKNYPKVEKLGDLKYNPWSGEPFIVAYRLESNYDSTKTKRPQEVYITVTDPTPYKIDQNDLVKKEALYFGDLEAAILDGSWLK